MTTFVALLRAVNVGGRGTLPMARLRDLAAGLGFEAPQTLLQSGNLVFRARASAKPIALEHLLETALASRLDLHADVCVRTAAEWSRIVERNPFPEEAESDPGHLLVMALKRPAGAWGRGAAGFDRRRELARGMARTSTSSIPTELDAPGSPRR